MANEISIPAVLELRVALTSESFQQMADFYREGLGISPSQIWPEEQGRALVLDLGQATLEVFDEKQAETVDRTEVGTRVSGKVRFALRVPNLDAAMKRLNAHGAKIVHQPVQTPWGDRAARVEDPDGMQVTIFEHVEDP